MMTGHRVLAAWCAKKFSALTLELYDYVLDALPPTPSKFQYIFNLRDLSRVFEGMSNHVPIALLQKVRL